MLTMNFGSSLARMSVASLPSPLSRHMNPCDASASALMPSSAAMKSASSGLSSGATAVPTLSWAMCQAVVVMPLLRSDLVGRRDFGGAELELGDLAERIERRVGQQVGGGLDVAERHEDHALGHVAVGAHLDLDNAAPRLDADHGAGAQLAPAELLGRPEVDRLGLDGVE